MNVKRIAMILRTDSSKAPILFRAARSLIRNNIRGGYRLMHLADRWKCLSRVVHYPIGSGITMRVPIQRRENRWDRHDVAEYERDLIACVGSRIRRPSALVDCGAEIGIFSMLLFARTRMITRVIAVEPNVGCIEVLTANIGSLPVPTDVVAGAIGSKPGWGTLSTPLESTTEDSLHMEPTVNGKTRIFTIDEFDLLGDEPIVVKLDVEGWEGEAIMGANRTLMTRDFVLTVEANGLVYRRTNIDPCAVLKLIPRIRSCELTVAEVPGALIDLDRPFVEQFPQMMRRTLNIVVSHWTPGAVET